MDLEPQTKRNRPTSKKAGRLAQTMEPAPLAFIEVEGRDHIVSFVNLAFCRLVQKSSAELVGKPLAEIAGPGTAGTAFLEHVRSTGEAAKGEPAAAAEPARWLYIPWPMEDGNRRPEKVVIQLTRAAHSNQYSAALNEALLIGGLRQHELREEAEQSNAQLQIEIVERKRAEAALREAQAKLHAHADSLEQTVAERTAELRASIGELEAFSYTLAHDLRAPLRAIHGFTQLALEMSREQVGPSAAELLQRVVKAASRMDSLIEDVLNLTQVIRRPITVESVDVDTLVRSLVAERPELSPPLAEIRIESPLLRMKGHQATLSQCVTNLLGNAVKFVELGVVPRVRVWSEERDAPEKDGKETSGAMEPEALAPSGPVVRLWVEDRGIGIVAEAQGTIFEIFQRLHSSTKYEGSGIGLAIVRKAIERMGGRVGVESEPGKGSRFWLELARG